MAGTRSVLGYVQKQDRNAFDAEKPLSALQTLILRNNTQHLIDMSVQYRFNWVTSTSETGFGALGDLDPTRSQFCVVFPTTITDPNRLPSYDIRVATRCTGTLTSGTFTATLSAVNSVQPIGGGFQNFTVSTATETWHDWVLDLDVPWEHLQTSFTHQDMSTTGNETTVAASIVMLKLVLNARPADPDDGDLTFCGVQIREYLSQ